MENRTNYGYYAKSYNELKEELYWINQNIYGLEAGLLPMTSLYEEDETLNDLYKRYRLIHKIMEVKRKHLSMEGGEC